MLKNLFLSLLILSTLTSEGISNLPSAVYKYIVRESECKFADMKCLIAGNQQSMCNSRGMTCKRQQNKAFKKSAFNQIYELKSTGFAVDELCSVHYKSYKQYLSVKVNFIPFNNIYMEFIAKKTDLPPPYRMGPIMTDRQCSASFC